MTAVKLVVTFWVSFWVSRSPPEPKRAASNGAGLRGMGLVPFTRSNFGRDKANPLSLLVFWATSAIPNRSLRYRFGYRFMPKPYLLARPSGLYVRFLVPIDLRSRIGTRFIVRPLGPCRGDVARLLAARLAVALSQVFSAMRQGEQMTDYKKLIEGAQEAARRGGTRDWTASNVQVGNVSFGAVSTNGPRDTEDFIRTVQALVDKAGSKREPEPIGSSTLAPVTGSKLSKEIETHLADLARGKRATDTITESRHSLRVLLGIIGDMPVTEVNADHIRAFWDGVVLWPSHASVKPEYAGLSVLEIIEAGRREKVTEPSPHTINKHRQRLAVFFNALKTRGTIKQSPLKGVVPPINTDTDPETGRPFSAAELESIFSESFVPWAAKSPHRWWGPILGLYSGARVTEVAQLYLDDIACVDGVWGMHINNRFPRQKIKTKASRRFVPLAQPVLDAGFLEFIEDMKATPQLRLFPHLPAGTSKKDGKPNGLGYGRQLSRQFGAHLAKLTVEKGVTFHAFRHTVSTALARADYMDRDIARITGHTVPGSVLSKHYIDPPTLPERVAMLSALTFPVALPRYTRGQFSDSLRELDDLHP